MESWSLLRNRGIVNWDSFSRPVIEYKINIRAPYRFVGIVNVINSRSNLKIRRARFSAAFNESKVIFIPLRNNENDNRLHIRK